jgi:hypothetical protein
LANIRLFLLPEEFLRRNAQPPWDLRKIFQRFSEKLNLASPHNRN